MKKRAFTAQEKRVSAIVKERLDECELDDIWKVKHDFTWRRPNSDTFSTIDRIFFSKGKLNLLNCKSNWALSFSDHAAVEANFNKNLEPSTKSRIVRLDPSLAKDPETGNKIISEFRTMLATMPPDWDPHKKLEFSKMCIRTVVEKVQADRKRLEKSEEEVA